MLNLIICLFERFIFLFKLFLYLILFDPTTENVVTLLELKC